MVIPTPTSPLNQEGHLSVTGKVCAQVLVNRPETDA